MSHVIKEIKDYIESLKLGTKYHESERKFRKIIKQTFINKNMINEIKKSIDRLNIMYNWTNLKRELVNQRIKINYIKLQRYKEMKI